jgi:hypothetical protein
MKFSFGGLQGKGLHLGLPRNCPVKLWNMYRFIEMCLRHRWRYVQT